RRRLGAQVHHRDPPLPPRLALLRGVAEDDQAVAIPRGVHRRGRQVAAARLVEDELEGFLLALEIGEAREDAEAESRGPLGKPHTHSETPGQGAAHRMARACTPSWQNAMKTCRMAMAGSRSVRFHRPRSAMKTTPISLLFLASGLH